MKTVNQEAVTFNSPYRKLRLSVLIGGAKKSIGFDRGAYTTKDQMEIEAIRKEIKKQDENPFTTKFIWEHDEWELLKSAEPQKVAIEFDGQKIEADISELKDALIEKLKAEKHDLSNQKVIAGTRGSGKAKVSKEETKEETEK